MQGSAGSCGVGGTWVKPCLSNESLGPWMLPAPASLCSVWLLVLCQCWMPSSITHSLGTAEPPVWSNGLCLSFPSWEGCCCLH